MFLFSFFVCLFCFCLRFPFFFGGGVLGGGGGRKEALRKKNPPVVPCVAIGEFRSMFGLFVGLLFCLLFLIFIYLVVKIDGSVNCNQH